MRKKIALWIALSCVICLGIAMWIYLTPTPFEGTGVTWNAQGEEISITVKLEERRFLWKPTALRGTIVWDGIEYADEKQCGMETEDGVHFFYNHTTTDRIEMFSDFIRVLNYSIPAGTMYILMESGSYVFEITK